MIFFAACFEFEFGSNREAVKDKHELELLGIYLQGHSGNEIVKYVCDKKGKLWRANLASPVIIGILFEIGDCIEVGKNLFQI